MLDKLFPDTETLDWLNAGAMAPVIRAYANALSAAGFKPSTMQHLIHAAAHFGHWIEEKGLAPQEADDAVLQQFQDHLLTCKCDRSRPGIHEHTTRGAARFLKHLRTIGIVHPRLETPDARANLINKFATWIQLHRGVTKDTVTGYCPHVGSVLDALGTDPYRYEVGALRQFMLTHLSMYGAEYVKTVGTALKAFLRFLIAEGMCRPELLDAVPKTANWSLKDLPRYLPAESVERVIAAPNGRTRRGLRDKAIILLLARLGLRARDIVSLRLPDIDWNQGLVRVMGKGRRETWLPLPQDAGDAVLEYLEQARPKANYEQIFLRIRAPFRPFKGSSSITFIVHQAIAKAGVQCPAGVATHVFRHSLARQLLAQDIPLEGIGVILRHRTLETSAKYAKIDIETLQTVVQVWPRIPEVMSC